MQSKNGLKRTRYFHGQLLTAEDFEREQTYFRQRLRRLQRFLFGCGVVEGLEVHPEDDCDGGATAPAVNVSPGHAVDAHGEAIVLDEVLRLPLDFKAATRIVAIRYGERLADPVPGERGGSEHRAVEEVVTIDVLDALPKCGDDGWVALAAVEVGVEGKVRVESSARQLANRCGEAQ